MKNNLILSLILVAIVGFFYSIGWWEYNQVLDKFHVCEGLGHGPTYCFFSKVL